MNQLEVLRAGSWEGKMGVKREEQGQGGTTARVKPHRQDRVTPVPVFVTLTLCCDVGVCQTHTWPPGAREAKSGAGAAD